MDPGSCPAASSPLLPDSEAAAPSGKLPASSRRWSSLPACARLLRGRRVPLPGRGRRRAGASAPPARSAGLEVSGSRGSRQESGGGGCACRCGGGTGRRVARGARPARESRGLSRLARDVHSGPTDSPGSAAGSALPCRLLRAGRDRRGAQSRRPCASCPRLVGPGGGGAGSHPGGGGGVAQGLISVLPGVRSLPKAGAGLGSPFALRRLCPAFPPPGLLSAGFGRKESDGNASPQRPFHGCGRTDHRAERPGFLKILEESSLVVAFVRKVSVFFLTGGGDKPGARFLSFLSLLLSPNPRRWGSYRPLPRAAFTRFSRHVSPRG